MSEKWVKQPLQLEREKRKYYKRSGTKCYKCELKSQCNKMYRLYQSKLVPGMPDFIMKELAQEINRWLAEHCINTTKKH